MIHLHNVSKCYPPDQAAIKGLDLKVEQGEFLFVAGASGAGKSTLLRLLFGAEKASTGEVLVGGRNLASIGRDGVAALRREGGVVFQDYKLLPRRSVLDNVAYGLEVLGVGARERRRLALLSVWCGIFLLYFLYPFDDDIFLFFKRFSNVVMK